MRVEQRHAREVLAQAHDLGMERVVIGLEGEPQAVGGARFVGRLARTVERLAVEGSGRTEFGRRLAGIERGAAGIAIDVDDRARERRANERRIQRLDEIVEFVQPPVGVLAREPRIDELRLEFA